MHNPPKQTKKAPSSKIPTILFFPFPQRNSARNSTKISYSNPPTIPTATQRQNIPNCPLLSIYLKILAAKFLPPYCTPVNVPSAVNEPLDLEKPVIFNPEPITLSLSPPISDKTIFTSEKATTLSTALTVKNFLCSIDKVCFAP